MGNISTGKPGRLVTKDFIVDITNTDGQADDEYSRPSHRWKFVHHSGQRPEQHFNKLISGEKRI